MAVNFAPEPRARRHEADALLLASRVLIDYWLAAERGAASARAGGVALPAMLLAGYAVENYAKARIIEACEEWPRDKGHDLPWLVEAAGVELDPKETVLMQRLKLIVEWAGRYPRPLRPAAFRLSAREGGWPRQVSDADLPRIERICERLKNPLPSEDPELGGAA